MKVLRENWVVVVLSGYFLLFAFSSLGLAIWKAKRRNDRPPVNFKLLRGPGETLRRRLAKLDEDGIIRLGLAALVPFAVAAIPVLVFGRFAPRTWPQFYVALLVVAVSFLVPLVFAFRWVVRDFLRYRDVRLGYLGEREVGEHLQPLLGLGYRVFHDVPADGAKKPFNLDHVAVGPTGVAVVETKTRRKGRARPGMKDHVVVYDGQQLIWPWGEDRHGLEQALAEADWLRKFIRQRTGIDTPVKPILALPGWWVEAKAYAPVNVVNSKSVANAIHRHGSGALDPKQIDLIARQLDQLCRDVES